MFEKETKFQFHTAFVPVVNSITEVRTLILYVKMSHEKGMYIFSYGDFEHCLFEKFEKNF